MIIIIHTLHAIYILHIQTATILIVRFYRVLNVPPTPRKKKKKSRNSKSLQKKSFSKFSTFSCVKIGKKREKLPAHVCVVSPVVCSIKCRAVAVQVRGVKKLNGQIFVVFHKIYAHAIKVRDKIFAAARSRDLRRKKKNKKFLYIFFLHTQKYDIHVFVFFFRFFFQRIELLYIITTRWRAKNNFLLICFFFFL